MKAKLNKRRVIQVYFSEADKLTVEKLANEAGKTVSGFCRELILKAIEDGENGIAKQA